MAHITRTRQSDIIDAKLRVDFPILDNGFFNTKYIGEPTAGSVRIPVRNGEVVVADYDKVNGVNLTLSSTTEELLLIDQDKAVNELIDGYEAAAVPASLELDRLDSAAYALGLTMEEYLTGILEAQGTTSANTTQSTSTTAYENILKENNELDFAKVPTMGRRILVSPAFLTSLKLDANFTKASDLAVDMLIKGQIGEVDGLPVFKSLVLDANTEFIISHPQNSHFIPEWSADVQLKDLNDGKHVNASALQGRKVYGAKVTKAPTVRVKTFA